MSLEGLQLGQYRLLHLIGSGGMGEVYLAEDARINQRVAIKLSRIEARSHLNTELAKETARLFQREAKAIAQLDHPCILPLFSYGEEDVNGTTLTYIVMPFRQEGSLADWLRQRKNEKHLLPQDIASLVSQAADALQYAHNHHIIHQDVKPSNFLIRRSETADSTTPHLLLTDFGIAKRSSATSDTSHTVRGTATYMAPEQWSGNPVPATDQYALAVMTYELLTGRPLFQGNSMQLMYLHCNTQPEPPSTYNPLLSKEIDAVILKALSKRPKDRFSSIALFASAMQQALQSTDVSAFIAGTASETLSPLFAMSSTSERRSNLRPSVAPPFPPDLNVKQQPTTRWGSSASRTILLLGLIFILVASSFSIFYFWQRSRATTAQAATPTPPAVQSQTLNSPTATTTNTHPYPPEGGRLVLNDPLSDNSKGYQWDTAPTTFGTCTFTGGTYHIVATNKKTYHRCGAQNTHFSNFAYEVEVKILTGSCAALIFRGDFPNYHYYYFHICQNGSYALWLYTQSGIETKSFVENSSRSIHTGPGQSNLMAVVALRNSITLYVNHQLLDTVNDSTYSQGAIGLAIDNDTSPTEAAFSNAKVWTL